MIGAGAASGGGAMDASNLLKPAVDLRWSDTVHRFNHLQGIPRLSLRRIARLSRRFQKIDVDEPRCGNPLTRFSRDCKSRFESHHDLRYSDKALKAASELAGRYINDRYMPDKAIDVIDEAGAFQRLHAGEPSARN